MNTQHLIATAIVAAAVIVMILAAWAALKKGARARPAPPREGELVAVIAAAVAAASGMELGSFRIVGVQASQASATQLSQPRGFNTPLWGHIDRSSLGEWK